MVGTVKTRENVQHLGGGCLFNITLGFTKRKLRSLLIQPSGSGKILSLHQSVSLSSNSAYGLFLPKNQIQT